MSNEKRTHHRIPDGDMIRDVIVHLSSHYFKTVQADVYEAVDYGSGVSYCSGSMGSHTHDEFNDDCRCLLTITVCWRGVWDERAYPKDSEYWADEMMDMGRITNYLMPIMKEEARNVFGVTAKDNE